MINNIVFPTQTTKNTYKHKGVVLLVFKFLLSGLLITAATFISAQETSIKLNDKTKIEQPKIVSQEEIKPPKITLTALNLTELSFNSIKLRVDISVHNPNAYPLAVTGLVYFLKVDGVLIANDDLKQRESFAANKTQSISIPVEFGYNQNMTNILRILGQNSDIDYNLFGNVSLEDTAKPLEYSHNGRINPSTYMRGL